MTYCNPDKETLMAEYEKNHPNLFSFALIGANKLIYIKKYHHRAGRVSLTIPDFVYGFLYQEEEPIFSKASSLEEIHLGKGLRTLDHMFYKANMKTLDLSHWDVSQIHSFRGMFHSSLLEDVGDLSLWNTAQVQDFTGMFQKTKCRSVGDLSLWDVSSVKLMAYFLEGSQIEQIGHLDSWKLEKLKQCHGAFENCPLSSSQSLQNTVQDWILPREQIQGLLSCGSIQEQDKMLLDIFGFSQGA